MHVYIHHFDKIVSIGAVSHMTPEGHSLVYMYVADCDHRYHVGAGLHTTVCAWGVGGC